MKLKLLERLLLSLISIVVYWTWWAQSVLLWRLTPQGQEASLVPSLCAPPSQKQSGE